jgi:hypothetical protein
MRLAHQKAHGAPHGVVGVVSISIVFGSTAIS